VVLFVFVVVVDIFSKSLEVKVRLPQTVGVKKRAWLSFREEIKKGT